MSQKVLPADLTDEDLEERARLGIVNFPQTADLFQREMHHRQTKAALDNIGAQLSSTANLLSQISKTLDKIGVDIGQMNTAKRLGLDG